MIEVVHLHLRFPRLHCRPTLRLSFGISAATNWSVPLEGNASASYFSIGPGTRFHLWNDNYFLGFREIRLTGPQPFSYTAQFALLTVF